MPSWTFYLSLLELFLPSFFLWIVCILHALFTEENQNKHISVHMAHVFT